MLSPLIWKLSTEQHRHIRLHHDRQVLCAQQAQHSTLQQNPISLRIHLKSSDNWDAGSHTINITVLCCVVRAVRTVIA